MGYYVIYYYNIYYSNTILFELIIVVVFLVCCFCEYSKTCTTESLRILHFVKMCHLIVLAFRSEMRAIAIKFYYMHSTGQKTLIVS